MAHIANLKKRAAALGLTITKCEDAYNYAGQSLYTLTRHAHEHDDSEMLSLHGVAAILADHETAEQKRLESMKALQERRAARGDSDPLNRLRAHTEAAIASGAPIFENIPAQPAKPYDSAIGTYTTPYGEGQEAFKAGKRWYENPYKGGSVESYQWDKGHTSLRCPELATSKPVHSHDLLCEAACCIWEWMLENRDGIPALDAAMSTHGAVASRHRAIDLAPVACAIWDDLSETEREACIPYDWGFIPALSSVIDWNDFTDLGVAALPDKALLKAAILATFQKQES